MSNNNITSKILTGATVVALVFALNVSGALAGFFRTLDGVSDTGVPNPLEFLFGYGTDGTNFGYGYGYGYGNGDFEEGELEVIDGIGGGIGSGGGSSSPSSSSSGGGSGSSSSGNDNNSTDDSTTDDSTEAPTIDDSTTDDSTTDDNGTNNGSDGNSSTLVFRDYSSQPQLATCGTSIVNFNDIAGNTFEDYIIALEAISGLNGNGNGSTFSIYTEEGKSFQPNRAATRSEYVKMILRALCIDYSGENSTLDNFSDGAVDPWQAKVVNKAAELGLINTTNATFRVNDTVSRAEALKLVMRAGLVDAFTQVPTTSSFSDVPV